MTDNTQELDEILEQAYTDGASDTMWQNDRHVEIFATAKQRLLDWHNKQIEAVLDRLELSMRGKTIVDTAEGWKKFVKRHVVEAIESERNKLEKASE